ncbi:MAG: DUF4115 domain-containing protein [Syntrophomonadaceae bacterium]|nr:DUF4115 domain-containing protein [Syntrophomonadaceae bacterium]
MPWGEILRKEREKIGYSLEKVEEETKIRKYYLEMMENDEFASLPPQVYATGFVKRYAKLLSLDEHEMVNEFKRLAYGTGHSEEPIIVHTEPVNPPNRIPWKNVVAGIIFLLLVIWAGNYLAGVISERGIRNIFPQSDTKPNVQHPKQPQDKTTASQEQGVQLDIKAIKKCWLHIVVDGVSQYEGILVAGEERSFVGKKSVYLKAGNAGGIEITYNGIKQSPLGNSGQVKEKEFSAVNQGAGQE